jgi:dihydroorotase
MTLYLTDNTSADEIAKAKASGAIVAVKVYPAGATTNSDAGVTSLDRARHAIAAIEKHGLVLSLHGEVTDADVDVFDRERVYVERTLGKLVRDFPGCASCSST